LKLLKEGGGGEGAGVKVFNPLNLFPGSISHCCGLRVTVVEYIFMWSTGCGIFGMRTVFLYFKISYENAALVAKFVGLREGRGIWGTFV